MPFVMEDGGRTSDQGLALLRQLAERAVASGRVTAPPLRGPVTPAAMVAHTVRRCGSMRLSAWLHSSLSTLLRDQTTPMHLAWANLAGTPPPARTAF